MTTLLLIQLIIIGCVAGGIGGLIGIGGSLIMIPALTEVLGPDQHRYQAAAMIVNFFVVVPAVIQHRRAGAIQPRNVLRLIPLATVAVIGGVLISELPVFRDFGEAYLRLIFGVFLLIVSLTDLTRIARTARAERLATADNGNDPTSGQRIREGEKEGDTNHWSSAAAVALPTGLLAGMLGVGGGMLAVPLQRKFLSVPMRSAIANSATIIVVTSLVGAALKNVAYARIHGSASESLTLAAALIPTAIVGSYIGSGLTHKLPVRVIKTVFLVLLTITAVRITRGALTDIEQVRAPQAEATSAG